MGIHPAILRRRRSGYSPASLSRIYAHVIYHDISDLSTLFQDAAGTTPVTADGDPVGKVLDKSGNGYHLTQAISAARPIYRTAGGLHRLQFDGVDDRMDFTTSLDMSGGTAILGLVEPEGTTAHSIILSPTNTGYLSLRGPVGERALSKNNGGSHALVDTPGYFTATEQSAFAVRIDGGDIFARRLGGVEHTNSATGSANFTLTTLMAYSDAGEIPAVGDFFGMVLVPEHLTTAEVDRALRFMNGRMGA